MHSCCISCMTHIPDSRSPAACEETNGVLRRLCVWVADLVSGLELGRPHDALAGVHQPARVAQRVQSLRAAPHHRRVRRACATVGAHRLPVLPQHRAVLHARDSGCGQRLMGRRHGGTPSRNRVRHAGGAATAAAALLRRARKGNMNVCGGLQVSRWAPGHTWRAARQLGAGLPHCALSAVQRELSG